MAFKLTAHCMVGRARYKHVSIDALHRIKLEHGILVPLYLVLVALDLFEALLTLRHLAFLISCNHGRHCWLGCLLRFHIFF